MNSELRDSLQTHSIGGTEGGALTCPFLTPQPSLPRDSTCPCCSHWCSQPISSSPACKPLLEGSPPQRSVPGRSFSIVGPTKAAQREAQEERGTLPEASEP